MSELEDDQEILPSKAFAVYEDVSGYNPKDSPSNGFEYLHQVICENSKLPKTMVADINLEKYKVNQTRYVNEYKSPSVKIDFLPAQEWQQFQIHNFSNLRNKLFVLKDKWQKEKHLQNSSELPGEIEMEKPWFVFCQQSQPSLGQLFLLDQPGIIKLLTYFSQWLSDEEMEFSNNTCLWLYSIFSRLEEPLWPSTYADLRDILRMARERRSKIESTEDNLLTPLNLIICVGARYFRQSDLCD